MPRKRYFCEYCDKSFSDNPTNRRNHLNGIQHKTAKKEYYDLFLEPEVLLAEDGIKKPCRKFFQGECKFGRSCKYSHFTQETREHLKSLVASKQSRNFVSKSRLASINVEETVENWLKKRTFSDLNLEQVKQVSLQNTGKQTVSNKQDFTLPVVLSSYMTLPPSVLPYSTEETDDQNFVEWG